jgi:hypothetical protein
MPAKLALHEGDALAERCMSDHRDGLGPLALDKPQRSPEGGSVVPIDIDR